MGLHDLITKLDADRRVLQSIPNLKILFPLGSAQRSTFLAKVDNVLKDSEKTSPEYMELRALVEKNQNKINKAVETQRTRLKGLQELIKHDNPTNLLIKIDRAKELIGESKLNFFVKKKLMKKLSFSEEKYKKYLTIVNQAQELNNVDASGTALERSADDIQYLAYYESLIEGSDSFSIMPELLIKKYINKGNKL
ncbi:hypothetical protein [Francisella salina]|uniref:Uncharacterized protein n=1 Tax=Francisella salina TaxID=573569 RepID=A0ABN3ZQ39_FRAST|nr:hypothetical protein [Francisella salina]AEI36833.1 hypothetical protein F7308_1909 [Francisella salina]